MHGKTPQDCMLTVIVPICKSTNGNISDPGNYWPVSPATIITKLFEHYILSCIQVRIKGEGQRGQLPRAPRCKGAPRDQFYFFQIKYSLEKFTWFRSDTRIQLYIIFLCCVKYQRPPTATDFSKFDCLPILVIATE